MAPVRLRPGALADVLPPGGLTYVQGCSGESAALNAAVMAAGDALGAMSFTGIFVPGLNRASYLANPDCRVETFFLTPELRAAGDRVRFLPLCYGDILARLRRQPPAAAIFPVAPPDAAGDCSFGPVVDFLADVWDLIPIRIAHINPRMKATRGHRGIPWRDLTAVLEDEGFDPPGMATGGSDPETDEIARHIAGLIPDGATLQTGLGKVPGALMRNLTNHRNLRIHSGLIGDGVLDLLAAGALAPGASVKGGVAIGAPALYDAIDGEAFAFQGVSHTHAAAVIAGMPKFHAINSALEIDLFGQAFAELTPKGLMSGPGGASDFARGARLSEGGRRIVALPSAARGASRIVLPGAPAGPVSLGRFDIDLVVTEQGIADLRGKDHGERAAALIRIAAPEHRESLARGYREFAGRL